MGKQVEEYGAEHTPLGGSSAESQRVGGDVGNSYHLWPVSQEA